MKLHALALAAILSVTGNAYATSLDLVDTHYLGAFGGGELYGEIFTVATEGTINHSLTFDITQGLYAGSGIFDIPLGRITNINNLTADIFANGSTVVPYESFSPVLGGDILVLPLGTYFAAGSYTLKIGGQATGSGLFGLPAGSYAIGAATLPVPEPETWAMLLVGMGLVGLRVRQKAKASREAALA